MSRDKYKTMRCLESATVNSLISVDWDGTLLHVLPMMQINFKVSSEHILCGLSWWLILLWVPLNQCCLVLRNLLSDHIYLAEF